MPLNQEFQNHKLMKNTIQSSKNLCFCGGRGSTTQKINLLVMTPLYAYTCSDCLNLENWFIPILLMGTNEVRKRKSDHGREEVLEVEFKLGAYCPHPLAPNGLRRAE